MRGHVPSWSLRRARNDDCLLLARIVLEVAKHQGRWPAERTLVEETEWVEGFTAWSQTSIDGQDLLQVIEVGGEPIGRLRTEWDRVGITDREVSRVRLHGIQLRPPFQNKGIGSSIVRYLQDEAEKRGGVLDLGVEYFNTDAWRLYERLGFHEMGRDAEEVHMRWTPR